MQRETEIDERGRIVIPSEMREKLRLRPQQKLLIETTDSGMIFLRPVIGAEEFIKQLKGCVSNSSSSKKVKAEELKRIWGVEHSHH